MASEVGPDPYRADSVMRLLARTGVGVGILRSSQKLSVCTVSPGLSEPQVGHRHGDIAEKPVDQGILG